MLGPLPRVPQWEGRLGLPLVFPGRRVGTSEMVVGDNSLSSFTYHLTSHRLRNKYGCTYPMELLEH